MAMLTHNHTIGSCKAPPRSSSTWDTVTGQTDTCNKYDIKTKATIGRWRRAASACAQAACHCSTGKEDACPHCTARAAHNSALLPPPLALTAPCDCIAVDGLLQVHGLSCLGAGARDKHNCANCGCNLQKHVVFSGFCCQCIHQNQGADGVSAAGLGILDQHGSRAGVWRCAGVVTAPVFLLAQPCNSLLVGINHSARPASHQVVGRHTQPWAVQRGQ